MFERKELFLAGKWARPAGCDFIEVRSPSDDEKVGRVPEATTADVDTAVDGAQVALHAGPWANTTRGDRADFIRRTMRILEGRMDELVELQISEMGSPRKFIEPTTAALISGVQRTIDRSYSVPEEEYRDGYVGLVLVRRAPVGVVGAVMPWNAPVPLIMMKMVPALLAGCTIVLKPAPETPLSSYLVAEALLEADLPEGVVSFVAGGRELGEYLISHPGIDKVTFTGSTVAGRRIGEICGRQLKPVTLELGGKSAAIVLDDADLEAQIPALVESSIPNSGQACVATTRILVSRRRHGELVDRLASAFVDLAVGDPHDATTDVGPLVAERQRDRVEGYIRSGLEQGARLVVGGRRPAKPRGWWIEPTVFDQVENSMKIAQEEIFGPVLSVIEYETDDEAVAIANDSTYGLGGAVFTADPARGAEIASRVLTGTCAINDAPSSGGGGPFGGAKGSGLGKEFDREGFEQFLRVQAISLPAGYAAPDEQPA